MVIAFQNLFGGQYEGGSNWLEVTLLSLATLPEPPLCLVVGAAPESLPETLRAEPSVRAIPLERKTVSRAARLLKGALRRVLNQPWEDPALAALAAEYGVDLWVGFAGFEGLSPRRRLLVWFPDFQFRHLPEMFDDSERRDRERQWNYIAERADGVLAISRAVADDALSRHPHIQAKVHVCGFPPVFRAPVLAADPEEVRRRYGLPERFFLVSNQFWRHKNHALVFHALSRLKRCGKVPPVVAFTGRPHDYRHPDDFSEMLRLVQQQGLHEYCRFLGVVPRAEQVALIRAAEAVIQPSLFEGRGAIVEETQVLGTQLLCSDLPVHRELHAPGARFFQSNDEEELARLMEQRYPRSKKSALEIAEESQQLAADYGRRLMEIFERVLAEGEKH
ncbi:MAG: glycosyltransferase family 4 protein [Pyrinomonadaceae bacterium]